MDRREFDYKLDGLLTESERLIPQEKAQNLPDSKIFPGVPQWHPFENSLWTKGEAIRKLVLESGKKPNPEQLNRICSICIDPNGGRGRQSFVMLLGRTGYASFAPMVAELLSMLENGAKEHEIQKIAEEKYKVKMDLTPDD